MAKRASTKRTKAAPKKAKAKPTPKARASKAKPKAKATKPSATKRKPVRVPTKSKPKRKSSVARAPAKKRAPARPKRQAAPAPPPRKRVPTKSKKRAKPRRPRFRAGGSESDRLTRIVETMAPSGARVETVTPEPGNRVLWLTVSKITFSRPLSYRQLGELLRQWEADIITETRIGPNRIAQMRTIWVDPKNGGTFRNKDGETYLSEMDAWPALVGRMIGEVEEKAERYKATKVPVIYIYFSADEQDVFEVGT